jgi:hypothetical protein
MLGETRRSLPNGNESGDHEQTMSKSLLPPASLTRRELENLRVGAWNVTIPVPGPREGQRPSEQGHVR